MVETVVKIVPAGENLLCEGDPGVFAYMVQSGKLEVWTMQQGQRVVLSRVGPGGVVGELGLVTNAPRSATVTALEGTQVIRISREHLSERLDEADPLLRHTLQVVLTRLRDLLDFVHGKSLDEKTEAYSLLDVDNQTTAAGTDHSKAMHRLQVEQELEHAVRNDELELHFQPIVRLKTRAIAGFEALIRWRSPKHGMVRPDSFIPVAEQSNLIVPIGHWIFHSACESLRRLQQVAAQLQPGQPLITMSVNLSVRQFRDDSLFRELIRAAKDHHISPDRIRLEITESRLLDNWELTLEMLRTARAHGFRLAIDDFGTGYSSLAYLHRLPVDTLKLDQGFIRDMVQNAGAQAIVSSVIELARKLGLEFIAEGVETREQLDALARINATSIQGYYFSRPRSLAEIEAYLEQKLRAPARTASSRAQSAA